MAWFKRNKEGIQTAKEDQIQAPDGLWIKCPECKKPSHVKELEEMNYVCPFCNHHQRIDSATYFHILFDDSQWTELDAELVSADPLAFEDTKKYTDRVAAMQKKTGLKDALRSGHGTVDGYPTVIAAMDFSFIGGSMGSVVGEKIARAIKYATENDHALMIIAKSGGARMMEGGLSLMQMAKTSALLAQYDDKGLPYISLMTHPTTGGVTASFAMLGDFNLAEPKALIGFAGPRVIKETIGRDLPEGFQRSEFLLDSGFLDLIVDRKTLKPSIAQLLRLSMPKDSKLEPEEA